MTEDSIFRKRFLECKNMTIEDAEELGKYLAKLQRDISFYVGDLARYAEARWPDKHPQVWPEWVSPGMLDRTAGVCRAYPKEEDRQHEVTYTQYMQVAKKPNRDSLLAGMVGQTTDESRKKPNSEAPPAKDPWLLAVDTNYFLHRFWFSGAGIEAAQGVADWIERTVDRLKEKGLTDCACCFDSRTNHRKALTEGWKDAYKPRPPKDPELGQQLNLVRELLEKKNFACVSQEGMEADDMMASYAAQFDGRVTLMTQDKDMRQCLSDHVNMLLDVEWMENPTSGEMLPDYKWLSMAAHIESTGLKPAQWTDYQMLMGDSVDGIKGCPGIGEKGAADLIKEFETLEKVYAAAEADDERIKEKKRVALLEFRDSTAEVTRLLVTLKTDLVVTKATRL
jgi:5'-3' exonuclease